ncbi:hypothetical protein QOZ80_5AG0387550 [Eleusine coracana subsp. coracana]|nr:hypothetical protein QOZ80_5AG0387550 [Eleusine coracana subsp. coracana]
MASVLDPVTGATTELPHELSERYQQWADKFQVISYAFGCAASTGEYKVLRLLHVLSNNGWEQLVELLTCRGGNGVRGRWRGVRSPPFDVAGSTLDCNGAAVVGSVVYFVARMGQFLPFDIDFVAPGSIASLNLETEEWMPILHGPLKKSNNQVELENHDLMFQEHLSLQSPLLNLTELEGSLVTAHSEQSLPSSIDLWFLTDTKEETWVKKYNIKVDLFPQRREFYAHPLFVLDGIKKIVLIVRPKGELMVFDLQEGTCRDFDRRKYVAFGLYRGCLLGLCGVNNE